VEQVIARNVERLFPGRRIIDTFAFRVTRSADLAVEEEEADDLLEAMESVLRFRQRSAGAVRLELEPGATPDGVALLRRELVLTDDLVYQRTAYLDLGALWALIDLDRPDLKDTPWMPTTPARIGRGPDGGVDMFEQIRNADLMVHHPYESFATSTGSFLAQAARDPNVLAIKQTLYRTSAPDDPALGGEETMVRSLMEAAETGKQVVVLVELKARFDEAANITWAKMLEKSGVHVVYGVVGLKTHCKALLVVRREKDGIRRYAHTGTGNYNPKTARIYEDLGIFTADPEIGHDLSQLFNALTGFAESTTYRRILVAPNMLRKRLTERIREEAAKGPEGRILFKLNHLVDPAMIDELYEASRQGCEIDLVVRGVCSLRPGVPGLSPTIRVRSIVGRFLEHSRIYRFGHPDSGAVYYTGSADLMTRNLDGRVEILVPVVDPRLKARLEEILDVLLQDDVLAWELHDDRWVKTEVTVGANTHDRMQELALERQRTTDQPV
jgi:polyphosphate kinase